MHHIKHIGWLQKQMFVLFWKGDFKGSAEAYWWLRVHLIYKSRKL